MAAPTHSTILRQIIDDNLYMALGTAGADGTPWVSPVYFVHEDYTDFLWVSVPDAAHSRNVVVRPEVSIVVYDSRAPIGTGQAVYMSAKAERLKGPAVERGMEVFSQRSVAHGGDEWAPERVRRDGGLRLFRAVATERWILDADNPRPGDRRVAVEL